MSRAALFASALALLSCHRARQEPDAAPPPTDSGSTPDVGTPRDTEPLDAPLADAPPMTHWPRDATDARRAILLLHGAAGPKLFTDQADYRRYPEALAAAGYHVFMPHLARCGDFDACTVLVRRALDAIARSPGVRDERFGVIGFSKGAYLALAVSADEPRVSAVVALYGGLTGASERAKSFPPALVMHGDRDDMVPVDNAQQIARSLRGVGANVTVHIYPGQKHGFTGAALADSVERSVAFMRAHP